jgi:hypothetical protein
VANVFGITISLNRPNFVEEFDANTKLYMEALATVFRATTFRFLGLEIKYCRVKTGRLKSGFTPIMDAYQYDYTKYWTYGADESPEAIAEGKQAGTFQYDPSSDPFKMIVINSVEYASYVEEKVGITVRGPITVLIPEYENFFLEGYNYLNEHLGDAFDSGKYPNQGEYPSEVY